MLVLETVGLTGMQQRATDPWKYSTYNSKDYSSMEGQDSTADASPISRSMAVIRNTASPPMPDNSPNNKSPNNFYHTEGVVIPDDNCANEATHQQTDGRASPEEAIDTVGRPLERNVDRHSEEFGFRAVGNRDKFREPSGLEQKIQKLRAEKEACYSHERFNEGRNATSLPSSSFSDQKIRHGHPADDELVGSKEDFIEDEREREPPPENQDTPLDFSVRRRPPSASGSLTDDSRASSSSPSHGKADYRGGGSPEPLALTRNVSIKEESDFREYVSTENHPHYLNGLHANGYNGGAPCSPESQGLRNVKSELAEAIAMEGVENVKVKSEPENDNGYSQKQHTAAGAPMPSPLLNGLGGLFPGLGPNLLASGKSAMGTFSQMAAAAAFMNTNGMSNGNTNNSAISSTTANNANKKLTRPFKAYPKEALQMPLGGFLGAPGLTPAVLQQGMETGMFAGMNTEDLMALYNQQLQLFREKQVSSSSSSSSSSSLSQSGQKTNISPSVSPNTITANASHPSPPHNPNINNNNSNHYLHFDPTSPPPNKIPASRPHKIDGGSPPVEYTSGSTNRSVSNGFPASALVSSTSSSPSSSSTNHHHSNSSSNSRKRARALPDEQKDAAYWERRRKNNDAAKRSRDARRAKEDEIALRAALLEQENIKLRVEVASLKTETSRLRCLLYNS